MSATKSRPRDIRRGRRRRHHRCWEHLIVAPLWVASQDSLGTLLRTIVPLGHEAAGIGGEHVDAADACVEIPMVGIGASLNVAVAGSLVLYRLAGLT